MRITKKNYIILAALTLLLCVVYYSFIYLFGFADEWSTLRSLLFIVDTWLFFCAIFFALLYLYQYIIEKEIQRTKTAVQKGFEELGQKYSKEEVDQARKDYQNKSAR